MMVADTIDRHVKVLISRSYNRFSRLVILSATKTLPSNIEHLNFPRGQADGGQASGGYQYSVE